MDNIPDGCDPRAAAARLRQEGMFLSDQAREYLIRAQGLFQTADELDGGLPGDQPELGNPGDAPPRMRGPEQGPRLQPGDDDELPPPRIRGRR